MGNLNKVIVEGRLTRDPEIKHTASGAVFANASIAVNRSTKNQTTDQWEDIGMFFDLTAWRETAELLASHEKGAALHIEGMLRQERWLDKDTGMNRSKIVIIVDLISIPDWVAKIEAAKAAKAATPVNPAEDKIPF